MCADPEHCIYIYTFLRGMNLRKWSQSVKNTYFMIYNFAILKACFVEKIINDIISTCFKFATLEYSQNSANYHCKNIKYTVFVAHVLNV